MDRQSSTYLVIDVDAAMQSGSLESFIFMIDTQRWWGSTGQGTADLTAAAEGQHVHTLNWIPSSVKAFTQALPRHFAVDFSDPARPIPKVLSIKGESFDRDRLIELFQEVRGHGEALQRAVRPILTPVPKILSITGEAVDKGIMFPALYGSPAYFDKGLYWSATVDTAREGTFQYEIQICLARLQGLDEDGRPCWETRTFFHTSSLRVSKTCVTNGFQDKLAVLPTLACC